MDRQVVDNVILALEQDDTFTAKKKDSGKVVAFGSEEARDDAIKSGDYEEIDKKDDEGDKDDKEVNTQKVTPQEFDAAEKSVVSNKDNDIPDEDGEKGTPKEKGIYSTKTMKIIKI